MNVKKILSLLVVLTLSLSFFTMANVQAAEDEFGLLKKLGFTTDFSDDTTPLTRYQLAQIALEITDTDPVTAGEPVFPDVPAKHKYFPAVNAVGQKGIMSALADGSFGPDTNATALDAGKVMLAELGYTAFANQAGWTDAQYLGKMKSLNLTSGIDASTGLTASSVGRMLINMLTTNVMQIIAVTDDGIQFAESSLTYIEYNYGYEIRTGVLQVNGSASIAGYSAVKSNKAVIDDVMYSTDGTDFSDFIGYNVKYILTSDDVDAKVIYVEKYLETDELIIQTEDIIKYSGYTYYYVNEEGSQETASFTKSSRVIINGQNMGEYNEKYFKPDHGSVRLVDTNGDEVYDVVNINTMVYFKVGGTTDTSLTDQFTGKEIKAEDIDIHVYSGGKTAILESINFGTYVEIAPGSVSFDPENGNEIMSADIANSEKISINVVETTTVTGTIKTKTTSSVGIDGVVYKINGYFSDLVASNYASSGALGDTATLVLNEKGEVIDITDISSYYILNSADAQYSYLLDMKPYSVISEQAVVSIIDFYNLEEKKYITAEDCKINGKKFKYSEVSAVDPTTSSACLYYADGVFKEQLIKYSLNENDEIDNIYIAVDHAHQFLKNSDGTDSEHLNNDYSDKYIGYDVNNFSWDYHDNKNARGMIIAGLYLANYEKTIQLMVPQDPTDLSKWLVYINDNDSYVTNQSGTVVDYELYDVDESYCPSVVIKRGEGDDSVKFEQGYFSEELRSGVITEIMDVYDEAKGEIKRQITVKRPTPGGVETVTLLPYKNDLVSASDMNTRPMDYTFKEDEKAIIEQKKTALANGTRTDRIALPGISVEKGYATTWNELEKGDIIETRVNVIGEVVAFRKLVDYEVYKDLDNVVYGRIWADKWGYDYEYTSVYIGYVTKALGINGCVMNIDDERTFAGLKTVKPFNVVAKGNNQTIGAAMIINLKSGEFKTAKIDDIKVGDTIIHRTNHDESVEVFIIRK